MLACVEKRGELRWVVGCSLGGERWDGEEEGEEEGETEEERKRGRESVGRGNIYWICRRNVLSVTPSVIPPVLAFGCPGLNPSVFSSVNSSEKNPCHPAIAIFKKKFSPPVYTDGIILWVYTGGIADGGFPSAMFTDGNNSVGNAVGVIRFSGSEILREKKSNEIVWCVCYITQGRIYSFCMKDNIVKKNIFLHQDSKLFI